ncbi:T3SS effector HopA1 family protein [Streptomyces sp. IBSNAI002]|uniref:T3SS effector HopA1 family protein n=1 Tax=Streptomyces sp. IBSNAI002 TaxID=3457500 RepID=UPI003FD23BA8
MTGPQHYPGVAPALTRALHRFQDEHPEFARVWSTGERPSDTPLPAGDPHSRLAAEIYRDLHTGLPRRTPRPPSEEFPSAEPAHGPDLRQRLIDAVPHTATRVRAADPVQGEDGSLTATVEGVRVRPRAGTDRAAHPGEVELRAVRPRLSPGFLLADASRGRPHHGPYLRLYVHLSRADAAPEAWGRILRCLEDTGIRYRAKAASSPDQYPRRDALVVYTGHAAGPVLPRILAQMRRCPGLGDEVSPFTRRLAPGVALACEPSDPRSGMRALSFGEHRARATADGLLALASHGPPALARALRRARVDPAHPAWNMPEHQERDPHDVPITFTCLRPRR